MVGVGDEGGEVVWLGEGVMEGRRVGLGVGGEGVALDDLVRVGSGSIGGSLHPASRKTRSSPRAMPVAKRNDMRLLPMTNACECTIRCGINYNHIPHISGDWHNWSIFYILRSMPGWPNYVYRWGIDLISLQSDGPSSMSWISGIIARTLS
jgi:hypothetical protein